MKPILILILLIAPTAYGSDNDLKQKADKFENSCITSVASYFRIYQQALSSSIALRRTMSFCGSAVAEAKKDGSLEKSQSPGRLGCNVAVEYILKPARAELKSTQDKYCADMRKLNPTAFQ